MHSQHEIEKKKHVRVFYSSMNISCATVLNFPLKVVDFFAETTENTSMLEHVFLRAFAIMQSCFFFFFFYLEATLEVK